MENKKILAPNKKHFKAEEEDLDLRINLDGSQSLLRQGERDIILDIAQLFNDERNASKNYKIYGKIKMVFRNLYSGTTTYGPLKRNMYLNGNGEDLNFAGVMSYDEFAFLRRDVVREINVTKSGSTIGDFSQNIQLTGYTGHTTITPITAPYQNWNLYLTYVSGQDSTFPMKYTLSGTTGNVFDFTAGDGIPFRVTNDGSFYKLTSPVEHGMSQGEFIIISGGTLTSSVAISGRTFAIDSVGSEIYDSEKYVVNILKSELPSGTTLSNVVICKRCINRNNITGTTSTYYVHKHKTLTNVNGYILDNAGFETPIWEEERKLLYQNSDNVFDYLVTGNRMESLIYDFKEPFVLSGITNNLGYTPTDVYITTIFRNANGYFNYPPKVGYKFHFHDDWIDQHFSGDTSLETTMPQSAFTSNNGTTGFSGGTPLSTGTTLTGAFVEYNNSEMKERIISETFHKLTYKLNKFNFLQNVGETYPGASGDNMVGLFYQPHYRVKLRQLSPYIETAKTNDILNLPENTKYFSDEGLWKWRDLYDHGFVDGDGYGTNYPFVNNIHYVHTDINFYLRNEREYLNKADGVNSFTNSSNNTNNATNKNC